MSCIDHFYIHSYMGINVSSMHEYVSISSERGNQKSALWTGAVLAAYELSSPENSQAINNENLGE